MPDNFTTALPLAALPAIFIGRLLTNVWEEVGWRGFALPRLQSRTNALAASLIIPYCPSIISFVFLSIREKKRPSHHQNRRSPNFTGL